MKTTLCSSLLALASVAALSGCAMPSAVLSGTSNVVTTHALKIAGNLHGGQQPVVNSVVSLWAAGTTTGYGQGATMIDQTTTDAYGSFGFTKACTTGQYLYITAAGGNSVGSNTSPNNTYIGAMTALPQPCSAATASTIVQVNELSTVAAVWSLQQFMSINTGSTTQPWTIGSPSTNTTGMGNAFAGVVQMVATSTGATGNSTVANTFGANTYTTTIVPDTARINTLGDILASCINSDGVTADGSQCAALAADVTPGASPVPNDTIQMAYYLATNPAGLTMPQHATANGAPTYQCNTYVTPSSPFQPTTACTNIGDWTQTVQWKTLTGSTTIGTVAPGAIAIDSGGNIWTGPVSTTVTTNVVNQFSPSGMLNIAPVSSVSLTPYTVNYVVAGTATAEASTTNNTAYPLSYTRNFGIAVDTNNNAWYSSYGGTTPGTITNGSVSLTTGVVAQVTKAGVATGFISGTVPGVIAIDGANNVFLSNQPASAKYSLSELTAASSYTTLNKGVASVSSIFNDVLIDNTNYAWALYSGTTCSPSTIYRENDATAGPATTAANVIAAVCTYYGATDKASNLWSSSATGNLTYNNISTGVTTPTLTTITGSTNTVATGKGGVGGLDNPAGMAIDGLGNLWVANRLTSTFAVGITELAPVTSGTTTTVTPLSEGGSVAGQFGFQGGAASAIQGVTLDGSGNVWFNTTGNSYLYHMVGAAAPVITPIAQAVANNGIGTRP